MKHVSMKGFGMFGNMEDRLYRTIVKIQIQDFKWIMDSIQKFKFELNNLWHI